MYRQGDSTGLVVINLNEILQNQSIPSNVILLSGDVKVIKPDPRIFQTLLERIGRSAGECLFIDDSEANITTARSLGFETIRFESSEQLLKELQLRGLLPVNRSAVK